MLISVSTTIYINRNIVSERHQLVCAALHPGGSQTRLMDTSKVDTQRRSWLVWHPERNTGLFQPHPNNKRKKNIYYLFYFTNHISKKILVFLNSQLRYSMCVGSYLTHISLYFPFKGWLASGKNCHFFLPELNTTRLMNYYRNYKWITFGHFSWLHGWTLLETKELILLFFVLQCLSLSTLYLKQWL